MTLLFASAPIVMHGKVHIMLCVVMLIFFTFMTSQKSKDDLWIF